MKTLKDFVLEREEVLEERLPEKEIKLCRLWDKYANAGYKNIYLTRAMKDLREKMEKLFLSSENGRCLDAGCGTGNMFGSIIQGLRPKELYAVDWSEEMLKKAEREAKTLQKTCPQLSFRLSRTNLIEPLGWNDSFFDSIVSNIVICYLPYGWKKPLSELRRVLKEGGYLYLSTFLDKWNFRTALLRYGPKEFCSEPIRTLLSIKYLNIVGGIYLEARKTGTILPSKEELLSFLKLLGFKEIKVLPVYWGAGVALKARLSLKPLS